MSKTKSLYREYLEALAIAVLVAVFLRTFVVQAFRIPTGSMKDTLLVGDFLLVNKFIYGIRTPDRLAHTNIKIPHLHLPPFKNPARGDIVIFQYPRDPSVDYIKRCIGLPGDTIRVENNKVSINGEPEGIEKQMFAQYDKDEEATFKYFQVTLKSGVKYTIRKRADGREDDKSYGPFVVPKDHYFMMGDNRDNSSDSRFWGPVPKENIIGKAVIIYFSFDKRAKSSWNLFASIRWNRILGILR